MAAVKQEDGQTAFPSSICAEQVQSWFLTLAWQYVGSIADDF